MPARKLAPWMMDDLYTVQSKAEYESSWRDVDRATYVGKDGALEDIARRRAYNKDMDARMRAEGLTVTRTAYRVRKHRR